MFSIRFESKEFDMEDNRVQVQPTSTIAQVKKMIETKLESCWKSSEMVLYYHGDELADSRTVASYAIDEDKTVHMSQKKATPVAPSTTSSRVTVPELQIFVNIANDKTIMLHVKTTDTIDNVRSQIHTIVTRNDMKKWSLWGRGVRLCHGTSTMSSLQIRNMEVLEYKPPPPRGSVGLMASSSSVTPVAPTAASSSSVAPVAPTAASPAQLNP
jgi:hypothetical protein